MFRLVLPALLTIGAAAIVSSCRTPDPRANEVSPPPIADEQSRRDLDLGRPATPVEPGSANRLNLAKPGTAPAVRERGEDRDRSRTFEHGLDELERDFVRAMPTADHLALELPSRPAGNLARPSDLRAFTLEQFRTLNEAVAFIHDRIDWLVGPTSKSVPDEQSCRVWTGLDQQSTWRLRACLADQTARRYEFVLSARASEDRGEYKFIAAGESTLEGGLGAVVRPVAMRTTPLLDSKPLLAGRIGYDFDNFHAIDGRGAFGRVTVAYRIGTRARLLNISLEKYRPEPSALELTTVWEYEAIPALGGRATIAGAADVLTAGISRGADGKLEASGLALSWSTDGAGRTTATVCNARDRESCAQIRQCWDPTGEMKFENFSQSGESPLGWSITECTPAKLEMPDPPDPRDLGPRERDGGERSHQLPDQSVEIPGPVALG